MNYQTVCKKDMPIQLITLTTFQHFKFSQETISEKFSDGSLVASLAYTIAINGSVPDSLPPIEYKTINRVSENS